MGSTAGFIHVSGSHCPVNYADKTMNNKPSIQNTKRAIKKIQIVINNFNFV